MSSTLVRKRINAICTAETPQISTFVLKLLYILRKVQIDCSVVYLYISGKGKVCWYMLVLHGLHEILNLLEDESMIEAWNLLESGLPVER